MGPTVGFPCIWHQIKSQDVSVRTATFTNWDWLSYLTDGDLPSALDLDFRCDDVKCDEQLVLAATEYIDVTMRSAESSYTFVYFGYLDVVGHGNEFCSHEYMKTVDKTDRLVGLLMDAVDRVEKLGPGSDGEPTTVAVMLSTDHGGHGYAHGAMQDSDIVIPAFVRGPRSIGDGEQRKFNHEVRNVDFAPTATEWLGLKQSPWWSGRMLEEAVYSHNVPNVQQRVRCSIQNESVSCSLQNVASARGNRAPAISGLLVAVLFICSYAILLSANN